MWPILADNRSTVETQCSCQVWASGNRLKTLVTGRTGGDGFSPVSKVSRRRWQSVRGFEDRASPFGRPSWVQRPRAQWVCLKRSAGASVRNRSLISEVGYDWMEAGKRGCTQEAPAPDPARGRIASAHYTRRSCALPVYGDGRVKCSGRERGDESGNEAYRRPCNFELKAAAPAVKPSISPDSSNPSLGVGCRTVAERSIVVYTRIFTRFCTAQCVDALGRYRIR